MILLESKQDDNVSSNIRCSMTTIQAVSPSTAVWQRLDKGVFVNEKANEFIEIPAQGNKRDLEKYIYIYAKEL